MSNKMKITVLSAACCNPVSAPFDQQYIARIKEALDKTSVEAQVELLPATDAVFGMRIGFVKKLWPLFNKYGLAVAPALFIDGELVSYGGVPTVEKLVQVIEVNSKKDNP
jgi:hypothetical protein